MKKFFTLSTLLCVNILLAQNNFVEGFFSTNNSEESSGLIQLSSDYSKDKILMYKNTANGDVQSINLNQIKTISLKDRLTLVRFQASETNNNNLENDYVFLNLLVTGEASLYRYEDVYYYGKSNENLEELLYKRQDIADKTSSESNTFRQQLKNFLNCEGDNVNFNRINYNTSSLSRYFENYNECMGDSGENFAAGNKSSFQLFVKAGVNLSSFSFENSRNSRRNVDFGTSTGLSLGIELAYPFSKTSSWSIASGLEYEQFSSESQISSGEENTNVDYAVILLPFKLGYDIPVSKTALVKLAAGGEFGFPLGSQVEFDGANSSNFDIKDTTLNPLFQLGVQIKKINLAIKYSFGRNVLNNIVFADDDFSSLSITLGYRIL